MNPKNTPPPGETDEEISALIEILHTTEQRLEVLTAGEVDSVMDSQGRTFVLQRAQEHFRHSEAAKQAAIVNALPAHIALLDSQGRIIAVNEAWRRFADANAFLGAAYGVGDDYLTICDNAGGDDAAEAQQAVAGIRSVLAGAASLFSIEYPCHSPTQQRWFLMTVTPLSHDHAHGAVVMHLNITERKTAELALQKNERQLTEALTIAKIGYWEYEFATDEFIFNDQYYLLHRITAEDVGGYRMSSADFASRYVYPEDAPLVGKHVRLALEARDPDYFAHTETRILSGEGEIIWVEVRFRIQKDLQGNTIRLIGVNQDITERKLMETALRESEAEFRTLAEAVPQIVWVTRPDGWNIYFNQQWMDYTGLTLEESLGHGWNKPFHPDDQQRAWDAWQHAMATTGTYSIESRLRRADGVYRWWLVRGVPLQDANGNILKWFGTCTDIHDLKMAELEIAHTNQVLRESERRFIDLLGNVELISMMLDREARITFCNDYLLRLTGWQREEIVGRDWFDVFIPPEIGDLKGSFFPALLANLPNTWHHENEILTRSGERRLIYWNNSVLRSEAGEVIGTASIGEDITERKQAADALRESEAELRAIFDGSLDGILVADMENRQFLTANAAICRMLGYTHEEILRIGVSDIHPKQDLPLVAAHFERILHGNETLAEGIPMLRKDGSVFYADINASPLCLDGKDCIVGMFRDITERKAAETRIVYLNRVHAMLSGINTLLVRVQDRDELFSEACRIAVEAGGFRMALIGMVDQSTLKMVPVASAGKNDELVSAIKDLLASSEHAPNTIVARVIREKMAVVANDAQNDPRVLLVKEYAESGIRSIAVLPLLVADEALGALALYASDIDFFHAEEMKLLTELASDIAFAIDHLDKQERLNYLAYYDVLTGLPNRTLLRDRLEQGIKAAQRNATVLAALSVDLNNFKAVLNSFGHSIGDLLLQEVARRLAACLRATDTLGYLDGDAFGIVLPEVGSGEDVAKLALKLIEHCRQPYLIRDHELFVSASVGIALFPDDAIDCETLFRNADTALYRAKALGHGTYQFFTAQMNQNTQDKIRLEADLRIALAKGEFLVYYQPKVSCSTGKVTGFEALLRWQHPTRGLVEPNDFIPALEDNGLIVAVGAWVLNNACAQARRWHDDWLGTPSIAVNISGQQIKASDLYETVRVALTVSKLAPAYLELELTESQLMEDAEGIIGLLRRLKTMGITLSIDDFGTGYSSLAYLKRFPIDCLKVDRAFVRDIIADPNDVSITRAIITLAHSLKLKVVAEGVETEGQLGMLIANHCDEIQGFFFSRPLPAEEATALLRAGRTLDSMMMSGMKRSRSLLLVDDEEGVLSSLKRLLRPDGYNILTASSAEQGLELLASRAVDVIVSDQRMPGMSGVDFLRRVKILHPETVRLVLSGYTDLQTVTDAINEGAIYKFLTKPWDDNLLRATIKEAFRNKEKADEKSCLQSEAADLSQHES